jgi:4a-hydroxytetrahydrobiopterin dehydratase
MADTPSPYAAVSPESAASQLEGHPRWVVERGRLYRDLRFASFLEALAFVNQVAEVAERHQHHPNVLIHEYAFLRLELYSHLTGGLSQKDVDLASAIDALQPREVGT